MTFRQFVLVTHRWLGLASAAVLIIAGGTGAVLLYPETILLRRIAGKLHQDLAIGGPGRLIVVTFTAAAVLLELGGLVLWWKRRSWRVRWGAGWRTLDDLHHAVGVFGLALMLVLAVSGVGLAFVAPQDQPWLRGLLMDAHTSRGFAVWLKGLYAVASLGFVVQGVTGVVIWWKRRVEPTRRRLDRTSTAARDRDRPLRDVASAR